MLSAFAQTKIQPPRLRPGLVARGRLEVPLAAALAQQRLVLLSAPAGFGKTAALTRQIAALPTGTALAWVSADADDDLGRFSACLMTALDPFDLPWRTSPDALVAALDGGRDARHAVASELLNALLATDVPRGLIVLEDAHRIEDPAVFEFLDLLVERLPEHWALVIASRVDPPMALARWRARGELAEFRQDVLRFTADEVERLLEAVPHVREFEDVRALLARTEGWAAGLRLVLGSTHEPRAARGGVGQRHLFDYFASEVLDSMDAALRGFLLRCSVLPELSAARCAAVSGDAAAALHLEQIEQRGLFVSVLDEHEPVLRLHDLLRDFLEDRLRRELPAELPALLRRAAEGESDPVRRVGYLAQAGAWDEAEALLADIGPGLVAGGAVPQVQRLIDQFPPARRDASPHLAHLLGLCAWAHWDILTMCSALERAAAGFAARGDAAAAQRSRVLAVIGLTAGGAVPRAVELLAQVRNAPMDLITEATAFQATSWHLLAASRMTEVAEPLARMVDRLEQSDSSMLWFQCVPPTAMMGLPGTRSAMQRYVDGALARTPLEPPTPLRVLANILQAALKLWAGRLDEATALLHEAQDDCRWLNRPPNLIGHLHTYAALAHAVRGEHEAALAAAEARLAGLVADERTSGRRTVWLNHFLFFKARIAAILDDGDTLRAMARELDAHPNPGEHPMLVRERATLAGRLAALDGRWLDAAAGFAAALKDAVAIDLYGQADETRLRLAHALLQLGRPAEAATALAPVFERVQAGGEPGGVQFAGRQTLFALSATAWGGHLDAHQLACLRHWAALVPGAAAAPAAEVPGATPADTPAAPAPSRSMPARSELLSAREHEVLARLAAGDSNKLIARAFDLSPHTVKRHVANILDKLALQSRGQAAAWYRERPRH